MQKKRSQRQFQTCKSGMTLQNSIFLIIFAKIVKVAAIKQPPSDALVFLELLKEVIVKHPNSLDGWPCERLAVLSYNCDLSCQPPGELKGPPK